METISLPDDVKVFYVAATSFPEGIMDAYNKLHALAPSEGRKVYGISRPEGGKINYKAAMAEIKEGEGEELHCPTLVLKKGNYICTTIKGFMSDLPSIGTTFSQMLATPGLDPEGYCVEWYFNDKDVRCMVRVAD